MLGFQMPKSSYVSHEGMAPEGDDISIILDAAVEHTPDIAPIVALSVTTGARRGELAALRRSVVDWRRAVVHVPPRLMSTTGSRAAGSLPCWLPGRGDLAGANRRCRFVRARGSTDWRLDSAWPNHSSSGGALRDAFA